MARWDYKLVSGKQLRDAIESQDLYNVLNCLKKCYEEIHHKFSEIYDEDQLNNDISNIDDQLDNLQNYEEYDMTIEDVEDEIDYLLNDFYDFCDNMHIWVELN